jgi:hypothetical protein
MKQRTKNYWCKRREHFVDGANAKERAAHLRSMYARDQVCHVVVDREAHGYAVAYSVANWYVQSMQAAGVQL